MTSIKGSKLYDIEAKVRVLPKAKIYVGEVGIALLVSDNLYFMVQFYKEDVGNVTMWFDFEELDFLDK